MPEPTKVLVEHRSNVDISNTATMDVEHRTLAERVKSAFIGLLICWLAAAVFVLVPVLHFFLVPLAALGGIGVFFYQLSLKEHRSAATLTCPACRTELKLKKAAFNWPLIETCYACRTSLSITRA